MYKRQVIAPQDNGTVEEVVQEVGSYEVTTSSKSFFINKHYLPYWNIYIDNTKYIPTFFDQYGRPNVRITSNKPVSRLKIYYSQTPLEKFSNILTIMGIVLLLCLIPVSYTHLVLLLFCSPTVVTLSLNWFSLAFIMTRLLSYI